MRGKVTRGTPKGGVLSPLLWLLAVNGILGSFDSSFRKVVAYADYIVLLIRRKFLPTISEIIQMMLGELSAWARRGG